MQTPSPRTVTPCRVFLQSSEFACPRSRTASWCLTSSATDNTAGTSSRKTFRMRGNGRHPQPSARPRAPMFCGAGRWRHAARASDGQMHRRLATPGWGWGSPTRVHRTNDPEVRLPGVPTGTRAERRCPRARCGPRTNFSIRTQQYAGVLHLLPGLVAPQHVNLWIRIVPVCR